MQMLATRSEEFGEHEGLGLIPGRVAAIPPRRADGGRYKIPHVGWAELQTDDAARWQGTPLQGTAPGTPVYLVHSFHVVPDNPSALLAWCDYGGHRIGASIGDGRVFGCQFHPEKSGSAGLRMLEAFVALR
jgi:glutamine amidotransferase